MAVYTQAPRLDPPLPRRQGDFEECGECFCSPCITHEHNRHTKWPAQNALPSASNKMFRRKLYGIFWTAMANRGAWTDNRYKAKKARALGQDPRMSFFTWHKRDILPECILQRVRRWFPKATDEEYVGHRWQNQ